MKIAYLFFYYAQKAGTERILIDKMNLLADNGYDVVALSYEQKLYPFAFPLSEKVQRIDLNICFSSLYRYNYFMRIIMAIAMRFKLIKKLFFFVANHHPDLIVCTAYASFEIAALSIICSFFSIPFIVESHSIYINSYSADLLSLILHRQRLINRRQLSRVSRVVSLTEGDALEWKKVVDNVEVIPNMVGQNLDNKYSDCSQKRIVFVGRFAEQKGLPYLLDIWKIVHSQRPDWQLHMYGDGPLKKWFIKEINGLAIGIHVHDPESDIMKVYRDSSVLMLTSVYEPFGLVIPEAMGCGIPVVSFDCPYGPRDIITDGVDGFLIPPYDVQMFADRLCTLMDDEALRKKMGTNGTVSIQRYSSDRILPLWLNLFNQVAKEKE